MKKKLTAVLLTLCMVVGLLPMSALAVWTTENDTEVEISNGKVTIGGTEYTVDNVPAEPKAGDTVDYYSYYNGVGTKAGTLTWKADAEIETEFKVTFNWNYEGADPVNVEVTTVKGIATAPTTPVRENFKLKGWAKTQDAAEPDVDLTVAFTADTTVYAVWAAVANVEVKTTVAGSDTAPVVTITADAATKAASQIAQADNEATAINVNLSSSNEADNTKVAEANQATIEVPEAIVTALKEKLADANSAATEATIEFPKGGVTVSKKAAAELPSGALTLTVTTTAEDQTAKEEAAATEVTKADETASVKTVVSVDLKIGGTSIDSANPLTNDITVSVKVDITISTAATPAVWWLPGAGKAPEAMSGVKYENGLMSWLTKHCSDYAFGETTITTEEPVTVEKIAPEDDAQGMAFNVTGTAGQDIVYDVQTGSVHTILWSQIGADSAAKVVVAGDSATKVAIWVADEITWDVTALKYSANGNIAAYEWSK